MNDVLKVSQSTHNLIRVAAMTEGITMGAWLERAVVEYLQSHRHEVEEGFANAERILFGDRK